MEQTDLFTLTTDITAAAPTNDPLKATPDHLLEVAQRLEHANDLSPTSLAREANAFGITTEAEADAWLFKNYALLEDGRWVHPDRLFVGNAYERSTSLRKAAELTADERVAAKLEEQAASFLARVPRSQFEDVTLTPRDAFLPVRVVERFVNEVISDGTSFRVSRTDGVVRLQGRHSKLSKEFEQYLNYALEADPVKNRKNKTRREIAIERTAAVDRLRVVESRFEDQFRQWLLMSSHQEEVLEAYDRTFNAHVAPAANVMRFEDEIPGWSGAFTPHPWQREAVHRMLMANGGVVGLDVGLGKTLTGVIVALVQRARGAARKPMIVVPKSLLGKWRDTFREAAPSARVLTIGMSWRAGRWRDDARAVVSRKLRLAAEREYDAIVITRDAFEGIPIREEVLRSALERDPETQRASHLEESPDAFEGAHRFNRGTSQAEKTQEAIERYARAAASLHSAGGVTYWEDLGIDLLMADEAHGYKNLFEPVSTYGMSVKYAGQASCSNRAADMYWKADILRSSGQAMTVLLTASIVKNSPIEIAALAKISLGPDALPGTPTVREFARRYLDISSSVVLGAKGEVTSGLAVTGFKELHELRSLMNRFAYRKTADDVGMDLPELETNEHYFDLPASAQATYATLVEDLSKVRGRWGKEGESLFYVFARMRKLTLDPALLDPAYVTMGNRRYAKAASVVKEAVDNGGRVLMFMDMGHAEHKTSTGTVTVNGYERMVRTLERMGIARSKIRVATGSTLPSAQDRRALEIDFASGRVQVVLGSTAAIGEGIDLQVGTTDVIHLDVPWDPGTFWQRLGRCVRFGNDAPVVRSHAFLARGSFDALMFSTLMGKRVWMDALLEGTERELPNANTIDPREAVLVALANDPEAARADLMDVKKEIFDGAEQVRMKQALSELYPLVTLHGALDRAKTMLRNNSHNPLMRDNLNERVEVIQERLEAESERAARDPDLHEEHRDILRSGAVFVVDHHGRFYAPGAVFLSGKGKNRALHVVTAVQPSLGLVQHRPVLDPEASDTESHLVQLHGVPAVSFRLSWKMLEKGLKGLSYHDQRVLPAVVREASEEVLLKWFAKHSPEDGFVVTSEGWIEERAPLEMTDGERLLLATKKDMALFQEQFPYDPFPL